jgi:hypothetical protein
MHATRPIHLIHPNIIQIPEFFMLLVHAYQPSAAFTTNKEIILQITVAARSKA